jgi:hypothetical protein
MLIVVMVVVVVIVVRFLHVDRLGMKNFELNSSNT